jgi:uncharacterized damage-inducible protein DinB
MEPFDFLEYMVREEHQALDKLIRSIQPDELEKPLLENDETTIRERISHILSAEYRMAGYLYAKDDDDQYQIKDHSVDDLLQASKLSMERHIMTLHNLSTEDLENTWTSKVSGNSYTYKFLLWHYLEHIATHRGQVAMALRRIRN